MTRPLYVYLAVACVALAAFASSSMIEAEASTVEELDRQEVNKEAAAKDEAVAPKNLEEKGDAGLDSEHSQDVGEAAKAKTTTKTGSPLTISGSTLTINWGSSEALNTNVRNAMQTVFAAKFSAIINQWTVATIQGNTWKQKGYSYTEVIKAGYSQQGIHINLQPNEFCENKRGVAPIDIQLNSKHQIYLVLYMKMACTNDVTATSPVFVTRKVMMRCIKLGDQDSSTDADQCVSNADTAACARIAWSEVNRVDCQHGFGTQ